MHEAEKLAALCFLIAKGLTTEQQSAIEVLWHFFHHKILFSSALQNFRMKFPWKMSEAEHKVFAENPHQDGPCSFWEH